MVKQSEHSVEVRGIVIGHHQAGLSEREIGRRTGLPHPSVHYIIQHWKKTGSVVSTPRRQGPLKYKSDVKKFIDKKIQQKDEITSEEIRKKLVDKFGEGFEHADRHIRKIRHELGYHPTKGVGLERLSDTDKENRVKYCKKHKDDHFSNVIWSDEKPWQLHKKRRSKWVKGGQKQKTRVSTKYTPKIQCWGAISSKGKTELVFWTGRPNHQDYINTLESSLLPFLTSTIPTRHRFQQDHDATHTCKVTEKWLDENVDKWFYTPVRSPDLNPIEMLWNTLEMRVYKHNPKNVQQLERIIRDEWDKLTQEDIDKVIEKVRSRIPQIIENGGEYVDAKRRMRRY
jgi:transposase